MSVDSQALELLVKVQTQGTQALTELANASRAVGSESEKGNSAATKASDALTKALMSQLQAHKTLGTTAAQASLQMLQAINPVLAEQQKRRFAAEAATQAFVKEAE